MRKKEKISEDDIPASVMNYLTGEFSDADIKFIQHWIAADKKNKSQFDSLREIYFLAESIKGKNEFVSGEAWESMQKKLNLNSTMEDNRTVRHKILWPYLKIAASWIIVFTLGSGLTWWLLSGKELKSPKEIEIDVPLGAKSTITLPDGSKVYLNAGTKLTYKDDYGHKNRSLNLVGEAYFEVAKDKLRPFTVKTSGVLVHALGTKFNIKAYPEEKVVTTTLVEGKIDVSITVAGQKSRNLVLLPNEKIIYHISPTVVGIDESSENEESDSAGIVKKEIITKNISVFTGVDTKLTTSWKDDKWIIEGENIKSLGKMLERKFNVKILFTNHELMKYKFSGTLRNATIDQILNAIKLTAPLNYKISNDTVLIIPDTQYNDNFRRIMKPK